MAMCLDGGGVSEWFLEATTCDAGNRVSFATGSSEEHEALQREDGTWVLWRWQDRGGDGRTAEAVDAGSARLWLLRNEHFEAVAELLGGQGESDVS